MAKRIRCWTDGSVYPNKDILYAVVVDDGSDSGQLLAHEYCGKGTVNDAEYKAVIHALRWALERDIRISITTDSAIVANHVHGLWECTVPRLRRYRDLVRRLLEETGSSIRWASRDVNKAGHYFDALLKDADRTAKLDALKARAQVTP